MDWHIALNKNDLCELNERAKVVHEEIRWHSLGIPGKVSASITPGRVT